MCHRWGKASGTGAGPSAVWLSATSKAAGIFLSTYLLSSVKRDLSYSAKYLIAEELQCYSN